MTPSSNNFFNSRKSLKLILDCCCDDGAGEIVRFGGGVVEAIPYIL